MRIEVAPTLSGFGGAGPETAVVVVDVFRASTTIATALANGARCILPVADVEQAIKLAEPYARNEVVLGGERECRKIEGFQLGNSPREYSREAVAGKVVIFTSTNGTRALFAAEDAAAVLVGSFVNVGRVAAALPAWPNVTILCAGNEGRLSLEDFVCAGGIVDALVRDPRVAPAAVEPKATPAPRLDFGADGPTIDDGAFAAWAAFHDARRHVRRLLVETAHARRLTGLGYGADLELALKVDSVPVLPGFADGRIEARPA